MPHQGSADGRWTPVGVMNRPSPALPWSMGCLLRASSPKAIRDTFWLALNLISTRPKENESLAGPEHLSERPSRSSSGTRSEKCLTAADWFSYDYKLMPVLGPLSARVCLGESAQRNIIRRSTASNAGGLCSVSQALSSLLQSFIRRCGRSLSSSVSATRSLPVVFETWLTPT